MSTTKRTAATIVAGLALVLGTGTAALASTPSDAPAGGNTPAHCRPARPLEPGTPAEPAKPIQERPSVPVPSGVVTVPAEVLECQPAKPLDPGTPAEPAKPIGTADTE
jgi:hypothetical protein